MNTKGYTLLGWLVYQLASRLIKIKVRQNKAKLGAAGVVALVLVGGVLAAKSGSSDS